MPKVPRFHALIAHFLLARNDSQFKNEKEIDSDERLCKPAQPSVCNVANEL